SWTGCWLTPLSFPDKLAPHVIQSAVSDRCYYGSRPSLWTWRHRLTGLAPVPSLHLPPAPRRTSARHRILRVYHPEGHRWTTCSSKAIEHDPTDGILCRPSN